MNRLLRLPLLIGLFAALLPLRAQLTESPQTIGPGGLLFEIDGLSLAFDKDGAGNRYRAVGVASTVVSAGLTETFDLQVGADLYLRERFDLGGARDSQSGFGDVHLRGKWKFWSDESLGAAAIIPQVRFPTSTGGMGTEAVEFGLILPWEAKLLGGLTTGAMLHWDVVRNPDDDGYDSNWLLSGYVQRKIVGPLDLYAEAAVQASSAGGEDWSGTLGIGAL